ncbi:hypothetical protein JR316_0000910 [Psilocybe cubensis]|nr:hypothetical protein JR316_0000910 [Psilocybe cubensis]KAH9486845.1 hypothetical protein JR316_0000910 [Psilocybe cubensis]
MSGLPFMSETKKCDAARPHCGTCVKQWQALVSVPAPVGYAHPTEPQCSYDPVEGLRLAPDTDPVEKIKELEDQIAELKSKLYDKQNASASPSSTRLTPPVPAGDPNGFTESDGGGIALPQAPLNIIDLIAPDSPQTRFRSSSGSPQLQKPGTDPFMDLLFSGWNPDLPDPTTLNH